MELPQQNAHQQQGVRFFINFFQQVFPLWYRQWVLAQLLPKKAQSFILNQGINTNFRLYFCLLFNDCWLFDFRLFLRTVHQLLHHQFIQIKLVIVFFGRNRLRNTLWSSKCLNWISWLRLRRYVDNRIFLMQFLIEKKFDSLSV